MNRTSHFSPLLLVVALAPVLFQTSFTCARGNANLLQLEYTTDGQNRIHGFASATDTYSVYDDSSMAIVSTVAADSSSVVTYQLFYNNTFDDAIAAGSGGGTATLAVPAGRSTLRVTVRSPEGALATYLVDINPACSTSAECDDGYECTSSGVCDAMSNCIFVDLPNFSSCDFSAPGDGLCQAGLCEQGFCGTDPIDCSGVHDCRSDGQCDEACDPNGTCERCVGQDDPMPVGTPCVIGFAGSMGNVCGGNGRCYPCLDSLNRGRCVGGANDGVVCDQAAVPSECPDGSCLANPSNVYDNPSCDSTPNECLLAPSFCDSKVCQPRPQAPDGTACTDGVCQGGVCQLDP